MPVLAYVTRPAAATPLHVDRQLKLASQVILKFMYPVAIPHTFIFSSQSTGHATKRRRLAGSHAEIVPQESFTEVLKELEKNTPDALSEHLFLFLFKC